MNKRYISGFLGLIVVLVCVVGMTGTVAALQPIQGTYDPMNPLEFVLACCQWELMKKIELSVLGVAPDEIFYTPELAALDYIPPGWQMGAGLGQIGSVDTKSYEATSSCCGQYSQALAQTEMDIERVGAQYQAWKASQAAAEQSLDVNETPNQISTEQTLSLLNEEDEKVDVGEDSVNISKNSDEANVGMSADANLNSNEEVENLDDVECAACAEAQLFAEWMFSQPKPITG